MSANLDTAEELAVSFDDVAGPLSQPVLEDRFEQIIQEQLRFRDLFRDYDATDFNSDTVEMPIPKDAMGNPKIVEEGAEFPRDQEEYEKKTLRFDKFGFEVALTMEAQADSRVNLVQDQVDRQARQTREEMNRQAFRTAVDAIDSGSQIVNTNADGQFDFGDILDGREVLTKKSYNPDTLIVNVEASHSLMNDGNFLEAGDDGREELRRSAQIGRIAGYDVLEDDSGLLGSRVATGQDPVGMLVDSDFFGYEGTRMNTTSEEYGEDRSQTDVYRVFNRMGWIVTDPESGVLIEG
jgi:HK97 family phage major capsid protein